MRAPTTPELRLKQGNSFVLGCMATDEAGLPLDLTSMVVRSQVRKGPQLVADLLYVPVEAQLGRYELRAPGDSTTNAWPVGSLEMDIQYASVRPDGVRLVKSTETVRLLFERGVTV